MGYRHYFYKLGKAEYNKIKDMVVDEFIKEYSTYTFKDKDGNILKGVGFPEVLENLGGSCIFEFGKLYWCDTADRIYAHGKPFFSNEETSKKFDDYSLSIISEKGFEETINIYHDKVENIYKAFLKEPLEDIDDDSFIPLKEPEELNEDEKYELLDTLRDYAFSWFQNRSSILNVGNGFNKVVNSWLYEHELFNLVSEYNHFDFENNVLIFLGW